MDLCQALAKNDIPYRGTASDVENTRAQVRGVELTTFKIGGELAMLIEPRTSEEVVQTFKILHEFSLPSLILGEGSNLLIPDAGITKPIIRPRGRQLTVNGACLEVQAGFPLMSLARQMSDAGLSGLEFAGGIPGSLGGATFMNAGAHGGSIGELIEWVEIADHRGVTRISGCELPWSYRQSGIPALLKANFGCVVRVALKLTSSDITKTQERRSQYLAERRAKQPLQAASAGSVFRNPSASLTAGTLIDQCGLKGMRVGGALVSPQHANWIINEARDATANDVSALIDLIKRTVKQQKNVILQQEVVQW